MATAGAVPPLQGNCAGKVRICTRFALERDLSEKDKISAHS